MATAFHNPDNSVAVVVFNASESAGNYSVKVDGMTVELEIKAGALQTVLLSPQGD